MKQIERLIARVVQLVEDNPGQLVNIIIQVDRQGVPVCWYVDQRRAEGLQKDELHKDEDS